MNFTNLWQKHRFFYMGILVVSVLGGLLVSPSLATQLIVAAVGVALIGIAHGAIDYRFGRELLEPGWGWSWFLVFVGIYLTMGLTMAGVWLWNSRVALGLFLLLAVPHFGFEDVTTERYTTVTGIVFAIGLGTLPIALPSYFSTTQTTIVYNMLLPAEHHLTKPFVSIAGQTVLITVLFLIILAGILEVFFSESHVSDIALFIVECLLLVVMFTTVVPILAFTIYYCFGHSAREMIEIMDDLYTGSLSERFNQLAMEVSPIVVSTLVIASIAWYLLSGHDLPPLSILAILVFVGLNVVFIPHMIFDVWYERSSHEH